jgi:hypothetical protein
MSAGVSIGAQKIEKLADWLRPLQQVIRLVLSKPLSTFLAPQVSTGLTLAFAHSNPL